MAVKSKSQKRILKLAPWNAPTPAQQEITRLKSNLTKAKNELKKVRSKYDALNLAVVNYECEGCSECGHSPDILSYGEGGENDPDADY